MKPQDHVAYAHTTLSVAADGTITGRTVERNTGVFGHLGADAATAAIENSGVEEGAKQKFLERTTTPPAPAVSSLANPGDLVEPAVVNGTFTLDKSSSPRQQDGRAAIPIGMAITARPGNFLLGTLPGNRKSAFACYAGRMIEDVDATFDPALPMPVLPAPVTINNAAFSYTATFKIDGRTMKAHREFISHVAHQVCEPELEGKIVRDINTCATISAQLRIPPTRARARRPSPPTRTKAVLGGVGDRRDDLPGGGDRRSDGRPGTANRRDRRNRTATAAGRRRSVEFKRAVAADHKLRLDFLYSINPDCTSIGFASVRVIEQPQHGRITVENGTGFTNFPAANPRAECNKRRSDGVAIIYEPEPGYTGSNSVDFETIYATGSSNRSLRDRHQIRRMAPAGVGAAIQHRGACRHPRHAPLLFKSLRRN